MNFYFLVIEFSISVVLVLLFYKIIEGPKVDKYTKKNIPADLKVFIQTQKIDVRKIGYKKLMRIVAIVNAIDIGIIVLVTNLVSNILLKLALSIPTIFIVLYLSYNLTGNILKKKGFVKNES